MDLARQTAASRLEQLLNDLSIVRKEDSYWKLAERLLQVNQNQVDVALISKVSAMLSEENKFAELRKGDNLLPAVVSVRRRSLGLKRELDQCARKILKEERQRHEYLARRRSAWPAPVEFVSSSTETATGSTI